MQNGAPTVGPRHTILGPTTPVAAPNESTVKVVLTVLIQRFDNYFLDIRVEYN